MSELSEHFLESSRRSLARWHERINKCLDQLAPDQIWWRGHESNNAIGNLVLHLAGNVRQWIVAGVGNSPDTRDRDAEFAQRETLSTDELRSRLAAAVRDADQVLARLTEHDLLTKRHIQVYDVTVLSAIHHVTEHFALHAGQIIFATKLLTGKDLGFYRHMQTASTSGAAGASKGV